MQNLYENVIQKLELLYSGVIQKDINAIDSLLETVRVGYKTLQNSTFLVTEWGSDTHAEVKSSRTTLHIGMNCIHSTYAVTF